jgi:hypothetical protein
VISYYLKQELKATDAQKAQHQTPVSIMITGAKGDTIYTGYGPSRKGINRFTWRAHYRGPTELAFAPKSPELEELGIESLGPMVLPGTYTVTLRAAGKTLTQPLEVRADPRIPFDTTAARAQLDAGIALRDQISTMNEMLNSLHSMRTQIGNLDSVLAMATPAGATKDTTVQHAGRELDGKLKALMDTIYNPDVQRGVIEDDVHHLARFYDQLTSMGFAIFFPYDQAPNELVRAELADLHNQLQGYVSRYNTLVRTDVAAFDKVAQAHNAPVLVAGEVRGVKAAGAGRR